MKKILIFLVLMCIAVWATGQEVTLMTPYAKFQIVSSSGTAPNFQVTGVVNDETGKYDGLSFLEADVIFIIDGPTCYELVITNIVSASSSILTVDITDPSGLLQTITTGQAMILRPTPNRIFPVYISGMRDDLQACIQNRYSMQVDTIALDAMVDAVAYATNALFVEQDSIVVLGGDQDRITEVNSTLNFDFTLIKPILFVF